MVANANTSYPQLVVANPSIPSPTISGGTMNAATVLPWQKDFSDQSILGAAKINPAYAAEFFAGRYHDQAPTANNVDTPLEVKSKIVSQTQATMGQPNAWKDRPAQKSSNSMMFGRRKPQKLFKQPWNKKLIPPLALFNDASQWVNTLMFNAPMQKSGNGSSDPDVTGVYLGSQPTPPIITNNLAAGTLNAQLQLGIIAIQAQQLTMSASNYFGGN
jgi:hypothetical protein